MRERRGGAGCQERWGGRKNIKTKINAPLSTSDLTYKADRTHAHPQTTKNMQGSEVGGAGGIVLPVARGGLTPTPCCLDLVIGCLFLWQQSTATASVKRITESNVTGPGMTPPSTQHTVTQRGKHFPSKSFYIIFI